MKLLLLLHHSFVFVIVVVSYLRVHKQSIRRQILDDNCSRETKIIYRMLWQPMPYLLLFNRFAAVGWQTQIGTPSALVWCNSFVRLIGVWCSLGCWGAACCMLQANIDEMLCDRSLLMLHIHIDIGTNNGRWVHVLVCVAGNRICRTRQLLGLSHASPMPLGQLYCVAVETQIIWF